MNKKKSGLEGTVDIAGAQVPRVEITPELLDALLGDARTQKDLFGPEGVFTRLKGAVMQRLLEVELTEHLGYEPHAAAAPHGVNRRNGTAGKTVQTETGPVRIEVPRDRDGSFEPKLVTRHQRRLEGFDEKVLALYARGMSTRDIQGHLRELYGTDVSPDLISRATDAVIEDQRAWQSRPLETVYPIVYLDALFVSVRDGAHVQKRAFYVALGVGVDGNRDVLGVWVSETEGAKFWLSVLTELKNRGVQDLFFVCCDGLTGFGKAVEAAFPKAVVQTCIVHLLRASLRYVAAVERKDVAVALRPIYTADSEFAAAQALDAFEASHGARHPTIVRQWRARWSEIVPFLAFPLPIRRILYTTNVIESLNAQLRKALRNHGPFPNDTAALKLVFLAIRNAQLRWRPSAEWSAALSHFAIVFDGRMPD